MNVVQEDATTRDASTHPIAVVQDRYGGCYSGGAWIAISGADQLDNGAYRIVRCLEGGPSGDDVEAQLFWRDPPAWVAVGRTADEAVKALHARSVAQDAELLADLDREIAKGTADLDAGRVHSAEEVRVYLEARFGRGLDAAE